MPEPLTTPLSDVLVDWDAFRRLSRSDRESFVTTVKKLEQDEQFGRTGRPKGIEWACIDLDEYSDYSEFVARLKKVGKSFYESRKAEKHGYFTNFFDERTFVGDIVAINTSAPERQGRPMSVQYTRTVEEMGGYPEKFVAPAPPEQAVFWQRNFGIFRIAPGHRQGSLIVDKQLLAYMTVHRYGNFSHYHTILGHKDYLQHGIMHKLHHDFIKTVLDIRNESYAGEADLSLLGLRFICYNGFYVGHPGVTPLRVGLWKRNNLFRGHHFRFDYTPALGETSALSGDRTEAADRQSDPNQQPMGIRMARIGEYDAFEKWELLCRYWDEGASVPGAEAVAEERLPHWHSVAMRAGSDAVSDYIKFKATSISEGAAVAGELQPGKEVSISAEMQRLWSRFGGGLGSIVDEFTKAITREGFQAASCDGRLSRGLVNRLKSVFHVAALDHLQWTQDNGEVPSLDLLRARRYNYFPAQAIRGKRNVLCCSLTALYGRDEVIHVHDACPDHVTLVDGNPDSVQNMKLIFPKHWGYVIKNHPDFLTQISKTSQMFDLVIVRPWPYLTREMAWDYLPILMDICSDMLIVTYTSEMLDELGVTIHELKELSDAVTKRTGIAVEFSEMSRQFDNLIWAVIRKPGIVQPKAPAAESEKVWLAGDRTQAGLE